MSSVYTQSIDELSVHTCRYKSSCSVPCREPPWPYFICYHFQPLCCYQGSQAGSDDLWAGKGTGKRGGILTAAVYSNSTAASPASQPPFIMQCGCRAVWLPATSLGSLLSWDCLGDWILIDLVSDLFVLSVFVFVCYCVCLWKIGFIQGFICFNVFVGMTFRYLLVFLLMTFGFTFSSVNNWDRERQRLRNRDKFTLIFLKSPLTQVYKSFCCYVFKLLFV